MLKGAVFCNYPIITYVVGAVGLGFWSASCVYCMTLAIIQNIVVSIFAIVVYVFMCWKASRKWGWSTGLSKTQRLLYIQAFVICSTHVIASWGYMLLNIIPTFPLVLIMVGHHAWQWSHGVPGVVYLALNRSIKQQVAGWFGLHLVGDFTD
ncbi:unnamed protein product, partial [Mesorhabditis spiculigera]